MKAAFKAPLALKKSGYLFKADGAIRLLEQVGMLKETTGREWGRVWVARPILKAVETTEPIRAAEAGGKAEGRGFRV